MSKFVLKSEITRKDAELLLSRCVSQCCPGFVGSNQTKKAEVSDEVTVLAGH